MNKDTAALLIGIYGMAVLQIFCIGYRSDILETKIQALEVKMDTLQKQNDLIISALGEIYTNTEEIKYR